MEQGRRSGDVLACPGQAREGFIIGDDPWVQVMGHGACAPTVSVVLDFLIELHAFLLELECEELDREIERHGDGGRARAMARDVNRMIIVDDEALPRFARESQNIAVAAALLHGLLEAAMPEDRQAHYEICTLLERAVAQ